MRTYIVLLLAALTLLLVSSNSVSGSAVKLQTSGNQMQVFSERALRSGETTDETSEPIDEERAITDIAKKLGTGAKAWAHNKKLAIYVQYQSMFMDTARTMDKFFKRNISPDDVYFSLKLYKESRRWFGHGMDKDWSPELRLWGQYHNAWKRKNPTWNSKVELDWLSDPKRFFAEFA